MKNVIETAIKELVKKAEKALNPCDAQQFAQAALNLAHAKQIIELTPR